MSGKIFNEDFDIARIFIKECRECLDDLVKDILTLEVRSDDIDLLNRIFTGIGSIKRSASLLGLSDIVRLSYETEKILMAINEQIPVVGSEIIDSLLLYTDFLNGFISGLHENLTGDFSGEEGGLSLAGLVSELKAEELLDTLKQTCEKIRDEAKTELQPETTDASDLDILQTEAFRSNLADGVKEQFLPESMEHIERIENDLLIRLDSNHEDREALHEIFRAVHSIKGGTGMYLAALSAQSPEYAGLKRFSELVHGFESLLALIRDKEYPFENKMIDLSYAVMDCFKSFLNDLSSGDSFGMQDTALLEEIRACVSQIQALPEKVLKEPAATPCQEPSKPNDAPSRSNVIQSIRVSQDKIDKMMNMISELIIAKNSFMHISSILSLKYDLPGISKEVKQVGAYLNRISDELQNTIMSVRMVEVKNVFQKMPRVVRDIAQSTGKKIELLMEGENTEIDKTIIEQISDPLLHLMRNAADHGIEMPEERLSKGKPEVGKIILRAYNKNKHVYIEIEDDGRGMDTERIKVKALEKGFVSAADAEKMNRSQLLNLVFLPGFSTAKQITEISGRGVGMDIVKSNISKINGSIMLESEAGKGTKVIIQLPLSLAVSQGLLVEVSGENYIIPLEYVVETVRIHRNSIHQFNGKCFTYLRGAVIRLEWLSEIFMTEEKRNEAEEVNAVILSNGTENYAVVVDKLKNEQEFVVKTLEGPLASIPGISGSTLLGNGQVVLIVNPVDLLKLADRLCLQ